MQLIKSLTVAILLLVTSVGYAFQVEPISADFSTRGRGTQKIFRIVNSANAPVAVQLRITTRQQKMDGTEIREPADDKFLIYPPQMIIRPRSTQKVRVQWIGEVNLSQELPYRLIVEQVPIKLSKEEKTGIKMILTVVGTIYVVPRGVYSQVVVDNVRSHSTKKGQKLALTVSNQGTSHTILEDLTVTVRSGWQRMTLAGDQVKGANGMNVLAGATRRLLLPWPAGLRANHNMSATLDFRKSR